MSRKRSTFTLAKTSGCSDSAHVHVGVLGKHHRGCPLKGCTWVSK